MYTHPLPVSLLHPTPMPPLQVITEHGAEVLVYTAGSH